MGTLVSGWYGLGCCRGLSVRQSSKAIGRAGSKDLLSLMLQNIIFVSMVRYVFTPNSSDGHECKGLCKPFQHMYVHDAQKGLNVVKLRKMYILRYKNNLFSGRICIFRQPLDGAWSLGQPLDRSGQVWIRIPGQSGQVWIRTFWFWIHTFCFQAFYFAKWRLNSASFEPDEATSSIKSARTLFCIQLDSS